MDLFANTRLVYFLGLIVMLVLFYGCAIRFVDWIIVNTILLNDFAR